LQTILLAAQLGQSKLLRTAIVKVFELMIAATGWNEKRLAASGREYKVIHTHPNSHAGYYPGAQQMFAEVDL